jgi:2-dehydro-3-deoxyphosphogluconate aldolase/(4S)-4-hydroxy-2-oxoglutarate aldolase
MVLGVGTIMDAPSAAMYINCGANFVVAPTLDPDVARICNRRKIAFMPGCGSLNDINKAEELGCEIVKIFPGQQVGGPGFVKAIKAPCPWTSIMATGGVDATKESLSAWFEAGVACVGMGSKLIAKQLVQAEDWNAISDRVARTLEIVCDVRAGTAAAGK